MRKAQVYSSGDLKVKYEEHVFICGTKFVVLTHLHFLEREISIFIKQELHSSRMHTARLLTVSPSMHCTGGVCVARGVPCRGVSLPGGLLAGGCLARGSPCPGGSACWGVCLLGGIPACTEADPPVNRITHTCKNITLPQLRCGR